MAAARHDPLMNAIKQWRSIRGTNGKDLTLQALGERLDPPASAGTVSAYESGKREMSMDRLRDIARALGITPGQVLDGPPRVPSASELAAMLEGAQQEVEIDRLTIGGYPSAVASALHERLLQYAGIRASEASETARPENAPGEAAQSRRPTKKASRG